MKLRQHLFAFMLPVTVLIIVPILLIIYTQELFVVPYWSILSSIGWYLLSLPLFIIGFYLSVKSIRSFAAIGEGTLAPWTPTQNLVIEGLYRYVRNPMISGIVILLLAESIALQSIFILFWCVFFLFGNHIYFIKSEEPGLEKRFGDAYLEYKKNVPRWIPRLSPWKKNEPALE